MLPMAHGSSEAPAGTQQLVVRRADEWRHLRDGVDAVCHQAAVVPARGGWASCPLPSRGSSRRTSSGACGCCSSRARPGGIRTCRRAPARFRRCRRRTPARAATPAPRRTTSAAAAARTGARRDRPTTANRGARSQSPARCRGRGASGPDIRAAAAAPRPRGCEAHGPTPPSRRAAAPRTRRPPARRRDRFRPTERLPRARGLASSAYARQ